MTNHTPAPWKAQCVTYSSGCDEQCFDQIVVDANGKGICVMTCDEDIAEELSAMIAAAPELEDALQELVDAVVAYRKTVDDQSFDIKIDNALKALKKARGEND